MTGNKKFLYLFLEDMEHVLQHSRNLWEVVRNKSIFITGGTGFFGKWLLESFIYANKQLKLGASITVLTRDPSKFIKEFPLYERESTVEFISGDILTFNFPAKKFNYIIHAATTSSDANIYQKQPLLMLDTITKGTRRVLDFAKQQPPESFLFVSSGAVYGKQPSHITHIKETDSFFIDINDPGSAYAEGKRLAELCCSIYFKEYNLPVKIARCFAFVGPFLPLDKHFAIGNFILNALKGEDIVIKGDGTPHRSYLYSADLAIWLWTILLKGKKTFPYNVGSDQAITIKELAYLVAKVGHNHQRVIVSKQSPKLIFPERYTPSIERAVNDLDISQKIDLKESIRRTLYWHENIDKQKKSIN